MTQETDTQADPGEAQATAQAFVAARRGARALSAYPGPLPRSLAEGYRIQDAAIAIDGRAIAGWKVGRINPPLDSALGSNRLAGPIFAPLLADGASAAPAMPIYPEGFSAGEAEFLIHIAPGWNGVPPQTDSEAMALADAVHIGIEVASSPYPGINADGPPVTASDFGNNLGLVIGAPVPRWRETDLCAVPVRTEIDGTCVGENTAANMLDGPWGAVRFLLAHLAARGISASQGLWVSSGAVTGVHEVRPGQHLRAEFGDLGSVECTITAATAAT